MAFEERPLTAPMQPAAKSRRRRLGGSPQNDGKHHHAQQCQLAVVKKLSEAVEKLQIAEIMNATVSCLVF